MGEVDTGILKWHAQELEKLSSEHDRRMAEARTLRDRVTRKLDAEEEAELPALQAAVRDLEEENRTVLASSGVRELCIELEAKVAVDVNTLDQVRAAIERLRDLKVRALGDLPIRGLDIQDGELFHEGIPFHRLNTAQQILVALELATATAGQLGLIIMDGIERLDCETQAKLREAIMSRDDDLHFIMTKVIDSAELEVCIE